MNKAETDVLVVGRGPAGGTMGLALVGYGIKVTVINRYRWTSPTPRALISRPPTARAELRNVEPLCLFEQSQTHTELSCGSITKLES